MPGKDDYVSVKISKKNIRMFLTCIDRLALLYPCEGSKGVEKCPFIKECKVEINGTPCQIIYDALKKRLKHEKG